MGDEGGILRQDSCNMILFSTRLKGVQSCSNGFSTIIVYPNLNKKLSQTPSKKWFRAPLLRSPLVPPTKSRLRKFLWRKLVSKGLGKRTKSLILLRMREERMTVGGFSIVLFMWGVVVAGIGGEQDGGGRDLTAG